MPYLQANTNNPFGFAPARTPAGDGATHINAYPVSSSEAAIFAGDLVVLTSVNSVMSLYSTGGAITTRLLLGVAQNYIAANGGSGIPTSSAAVSSTGLCYVYDDPAQLYYVQDTTSGTLGSTGVHKSVAVLSTGPVGSTGPNTTLGRSVMCLSGNTASSSGAVRILEMHPIEAGLYTSAGSASPRKYIVQLMNHIYGAGTGTLGVVTT